jgi:NAD(P)-dependent dehydrogenase (short-subunit alcohol dehydrogenase family)
MAMTATLVDRIALVTGGGRGIGREIALHLAAAGADLALLGPDEAELSEAAAEIQRRGRRAVVVTADVADESQVQQAVAQTRAALGPIGVLINNAGIVGPTAPLWDVPRSAWDHVLAVNLTGAYLCCRAVVPDMLQRREGKIINIASVAGKMAYALRAPYAVSKWGLIGLTMTLAKELGPFNVQVNAVCPGPVEGPRIRDIIQTRAAQQERSVEEVYGEYVSRAALGRFVQATEVAQLVAFLASPAADGVTGQAWDVSAGYGL